MIDAERLGRLFKRLQARAQPLLSSNLVPFLLGDTQVGCVQPATAQFLTATEGFVLVNGALTVVNDEYGIGARTALIAETVRTMRDAGMIRGWRNEALPVGDPTLALIERAACRPFGITTQAVHLNAYADADTLFVARRSAHKQIDPNLWDNLVGGMMSGGETADETLEREAWEEAGLRLDTVALTRGRSFRVRRPVPEGLQSEIIHVYDATLPSGVSLANQDGEVAVIERRSLDEVVEAIEREEFTLESALVTLESMTRDAADGSNEFFYWAPR